MVGEAVPLDDQQHVHHQEEHGVGAQAAMPRGQPVEANGVLEPGEPSHQQQLHQHQVGAQQSGQTSGRGDRGPEAVQRAGVQPPHQHDGGGPADQRRADTDSGWQKVPKGSAALVLPLGCHGHQQSTSS